MKDNRGISLVELLITVTILAIVIVTAATFMMTGSRSFARGSADSNVQSEAELAVNQIEDLVIDVNGGVDYVKDDTANTEQLQMYHVEADSSGVSVYKKRSVTWNKSDNNIYSSEWIVDKDPSSGAYVPISTVYDNQLLAENVTAFNVDLSDKIKETAKDGTDIDIVRSVVIRVDCLDGTGRAAYATTPLITLRNRLVLSADPDTIFPNVPTPDDSILLYISDTGMEAALPIRDRVTTVERGRNYNIFAMVNASTNVNSLCDWKVEGEASGELSTMNVSGVLAELDVDISEPNDYLLITASYKTNSAKKATGVVKVIGGSSIKSLDAVKIYVKGFDPFTPVFGSIVTAPGFTQEDMDALDYTWTVSDMDKVEPFEDKKTDLNLTVKKKEENYGKTFTITLVVHSDVTGQTVSDQLVYRIDSGDDNRGGDSSMERGKAAYGNYGNHGDNWFWFDAPSGKCKLSYEYYFCDVYGNYISSLDYLKPHILINMNGGYYDDIWGGRITYNLTFDEELPPDRDYNIMVIVTLDYEPSWQYPSGMTWQYDRIHYIPAVQLFGETTYCTATVNSGFEFYYNIIGYFAESWRNSNPPVYEYEVADLVYDAPEGVTVTATAGGAERVNTVRLWSRATFECSDWDRAGEIVLKSAKIKISLKGHPNIYTYAYVYFN